MFKIRNSKAYAHGCYIRPGAYIDVWRDITRLAKEHEVSVSEFVSHTLHLALYGTVASHSKLKRKR